MFRIAASSLAILSLAACSGQPATPEPLADGSLVSEDGLKLVPLAEGLEFPWGLAELPDGSLLVTEREGRLRLITADGLVEAPLTGLPDDILVERQGGLLGIVLDPGFATNRKLYLSYAKGPLETNTTAVISATLSGDATALSDVTEIFTAAPRSTGFHFGSRLVFLPDGSLMISLGDGGRYMEESQDPQNLHGSIARVMPDGSVPADNPFTDGSGHPALWSYGHRNVQGMVYDATRDILYAHEHGPKGGDELNVVEPGKNYGWPTITYGINYDGSIITDQTEAPGMEQPIVKWVPSIAPSGMALVQTEGFEDWKGDLLIGGMNGPAGVKLVRVALDDAGNVTGTEDLLEDLNVAYRDVISTPSGIYVATTDLDGFVYRVEKTD
ncbi:PQQ-dependent sugar dehydrogenase [Hyphomonas sp. FCG-A18]|uniref:PQQ-dependent sugar dehydrogenase n=1 Tax=Hyphomonas sp. FCG-A18 TaxID=3080019 RepID=UPI002B306A30|nr:PQQ-dependent sugar dehydrogenase [Hyphomonas sp. FCG-A18]